MNKPSNLKPNQETVDYYKNKLEDLLSSIDIKIDIILRDVANERQEFFNGVETKCVNLWIDKIVINNKDVKDLILDYLVVETIDINDDDNKIWQLALDIQNCVYRNTNKKATNPNDGDVYWDLFKKRK